MTSVLTDPDAFPALHDELYGRRGGPEAVGGGHPKAERRAARELVDRCLDAAAPEALLTTSAEELPVWAPAVDERGGRLDVARKGRLSGLVGDVLTFDGTGSFDPDSDPIVSYVWDFGDGTSDTGAVVTKSYGNAGSYLVPLTVSGGSLAGNDATTVTISDPPTGGPVALMASRGNNSVAGVGTVRNEDIVEYDPGTGNFVLVFDGSDVGLASAAIDALHVEANGDIVLRFTGPFSVPGLVGGPSGTSVDDSDLVTFTPSLLGPNTSGVFTFLFDGADVGLTANGEDVDGVSRDGAGNLMISTVGSMSGTGASGRDEDVFRFTSSSLGATTAGSFALRFDGSDMGLANGGAEDVDAIHVDGSSSMYLSTVGACSASGLSGGDEDVSLFTGTFGGATSGSLSLWFDGSAAGLPGNWDVAGLCIQ